MLIALGIAPGLRCLSYCALEFTDIRRGHARLLDAEVLTGARLVKNANVFNLAAKFRVHSRILDLVWERHSPTVLGIGPRAEPDEPSEYVNLASSTIRAFAHATGRVSTFAVSVSEMHMILDANSRSLAKEVRRRLDGSFDSKDKRQMLSVAAALCAGLEMLAPPEDRILE